MLTIRTDLAAEAHELWRENAKNTTELPGVRAREERVNDYPVNRVQILDREGERVLGKPQGTYLTLDLSALRRGDSDALERAVDAAAQLLAPMLPDEGTVLVAGIGNRRMTPDALGPLTLEHLLITRHLGEVLPDFRPVAAIGAGVLGTTGMEVAEWVRGAAQRIRPAAVVLVDALAARSLERLCTTIQIADSGLVPGSGVGNHRKALTRDTLGVPVISVGVPTVVDAATLSMDIVGVCGGEINRANLPQGGRNLFVTPDSIDAKISDMAKLIGYGLNLALQPQLGFEDMAALVE
ncbi:MAG: GPR endopeptidase [Oscillospiraceae bacterium]|nr:GPR endopeptidase [Oscillospiraceae bacterium]